VTEDSATLTQRHRELAEGAESPESVSDSRRMPSGDGGVVEQASI